MTKRYISICLSIVLLLFMFGCYGSTEQLQQPVAFYYPEKVRDDGSIRNVISTEYREGTAFSGDLQLFLASYLAGPNDPALYSPFPANTDLIEANISEGKVTLHFSSSFGELSSLDRTIACACISRSCIEFTGAESVEIFAENTLFDGVESILITRDNLLTQDNTPITDP